MFQGLKVRQNCSFRSFGIINFVFGLTQMLGGGSDFGSRVIFRIGKPRKERVDLLVVLRSVKSQDVYVRSVIDDQGIDSTGS